MTVDIKGKRRDAGSMGGLADGIRSDETGVEGTIGAIASEASFSRFSASTKSRKNACRNACRVVNLGLKNLNRVWYLKKSVRFFEEDVWYF